MIYLKILLGIIFYDLVLKTAVKASIIVAVKRSKRVRGWVFNIIHYQIRKGYIKIDEGGRVRT